MNMNAVWFRLPYTLVFLMSLKAPQHPRGKHQLNAADLLLWYLNTYLLVRCCFEEECYVRVPRMRIGGRRGKNDGKGNRAGRPIELIRGWTRV